MALQYSVQSSDENSLNLNITFRVAAEEVGNLVSKRIDNFSPPQLKGFRPNKVPEQLSIQLRRAKAYNSVREELAQAVLMEYLREKQITLLEDPDIFFEAGSWDRELLFSASLNVLPAFTVVGYEKEKLQSYIENATDPDVKRAKIFSAIMHANSDALEPLRNYLSGMSELAFDTQVSDKILNQFTPSERIIIGVLLDRIAQQERISVSEEEITSKTKSLAVDLGLSMADLNQFMESPSSRELARRELIRQEVIDWLLKHRA